MSIIANVSERVIMNMSVSISLNGSSSMITTIGYMNINVCINLPTSSSGN